MINTAKNLLIGFIRNSQTRIRYELYAEIAKKEKFYMISKTFIDYAEERKFNANWFYKMIQKSGMDEKLNSLIVDIKNPCTFGSTQENLECSIRGEEEEWQYLYPNFSNSAELEGYRELAKKLKELIQTERNHSQRLMLFLNLINNDAFSKEQSIPFWKCLACGYEVAVDELPNDFICPSCDHDKSYFQKKVLLIVTDKKSIEKKEVSGWVCMECGTEVVLDELPNDWKCSSCGRSKAYFKRKIIKPYRYDIFSSQREKAEWICLECGSKEEIEMPVGWKCPKCGFPHESQEK